MYLYIIISIVILIAILYFNKRKIKEGIGAINVNEKKQPEEDKALYDFNLEQAQKIWQNVGCTEGTMKPTASNKHWEYESWEAEADAYKKESDKLDMEHNYYDWTGDIKEGEELKGKDGKRVFPIGIRESYNRCHGGDLGEYKMPKPGDRVKKKKQPTTNTQLGKKDDYYTGIVLDGDSNKTLALWDAFGNDDSTAPDEKRMVTRDVPTEVLKRNPVASKIEKIIDKFGWPEWKWNRNPEMGGRGGIEKQKATNNKYSWLNGDNHYSDSKELYKMTECKEDTDCDQLKCSKRKSYVLAQYPITYICDGDDRNESNDKWYCKSGDAKGEVSTYYDRSKMCNKFLKPRNLPQKYCGDKCSGGTKNCIPFKSHSHIKTTLYDKNTCYAEVKGKNDKNETVQAIILDDKKYTAADLKKKGIHDVKQIKALGHNACLAHLDGSKKGEKSIYGIKNFMSIELKRPNKVKIYVNDYDGNKCGLKAFPGKGGIQLSGTIGYMAKHERNAFFRCGEDSDVFLWEEGKLTTTDEYKCGLEWDSEKGPGSEKIMGIGDNERNAKFDCESKGNSFTFKNGKFAPTGSESSCGMEWSSHSWPSILKFGKIERQAKFDCSGSFDGITMKSVYS